MKKLTLTNVFHNTQVTVQSSCFDTPEEYWLAVQFSAQNPENNVSRRQLRKIEKALCGMTDCKYGVFRPK